MPKTNLHPKNFEHEEIARAIIDANPFLTGKICKSASVEMLDVVPLMTETVRFLNLIAYHEVSLTPSLKVDLTWHELILCTRFYQSWCDQFWHRFLHHSPGGDPHQNRQQFKLTLQLYQRYYGKVPVRYWGNLAGTNCGGCQAFADK